MRETGEHSAGLRGGEMRKQRRLLLEAAANVTGLVWLALLGQATHRAWRSLTFRLLQCFGDGGYPLQPMHWVARNVQDRHAGERGGKLAIIRRECVNSGPAG